MPNGDATLTWRSKFKLMVGLITPPVKSTSGKSFWNSSLRLIESEIDSYRVSLRGAIPDGRLSHGYCVVSCWSYMVCRS